MTKFQIDSILVALICAILTSLIVGLALIALVTGRNAAGKVYSPALRGDIRTMDAKLIALQCMFETYLQTKRSRYTARIRTMPTRCNRSEYDYVPNASDPEPPMPTAMKLISETKPKLLDRSKSVDFTTFTAT